MLSIRLKALRTQQRKTQQEMADLLGITRQGYAKYENNLGEPDNSTLSKLADFFEVSTDYLLGRTDNPAHTLKEKDDADFQAFANDPELKVFYRELPESDEEAVRKLRNIWEIIKNDKK
ncbi:helix-turn-helix domain-containing protein [Lysinibacillus fusiformis]|uniref:helix-turn-helix domain-containing protein n=1 Tax=Lysinibacillus fusiformis TaxID=28031 RepID=UPI001F4D98AF|nr:helix-turn-helix transcriptional regulator [Lysinibacillus fusiformis]MCK1987874.1 helix-turn-helix domain-containing protein [Lysinibacillus fusiformis]